ncbi:MAG: hypothetical protein J4N95_02960 [Chloroflexi bacterium]|nr:hypothetical protein [Chloroflexota bacterium]
MPDGEWEVALSFADDLEPVPGQPIQLVHAPLCHGVDGAACPIQPQRLYVQRVTIANAEVVNADFLLQERVDVDVEIEPRPSPQTTLSTSDNGQIGLIAGASVLLAILVVGTVVLGRRRARR